MQVFYQHIVTYLLYFSSKIFRIHSKTSNSFGFSGLFPIFSIFSQKHSHARPIPYTIIQILEAFMGDLSSCGCSNDYNTRSNNNCGCGCGRSGNNSMWWIIILLFFCGGCGNNGSIFGSNRSGCDDCDNDNNCCSSIIWIILLSCICGNGSIF